MCGRGQLVDLDGVGADEAGGGDDAGDGGPERLDAAVLGEDEEGERQVGEEEGDDEGEAGEAEVGEYEGEADDPEYGFRLHTEGTHRAQKTLSTELHEVLTLLAPSVGD